MKEEQKESELVARCYCALSDDKGTVPGIIRKTHKRQPKQLLEDEPRPKVWIIEYKHECAFGKEDCAR